MCGAVDGLWAYFFILDAGMFMYMEESNISSNGHNKTIIIIENKEQ